MILTKHHSLEAAVAGWFADHYGVISRREALALGLTPAQITARVRARRWEVDYRGVYHLAGSPRHRLTVLREPVLVGGPTAAVSHRSAAWLWGLLPPEGTTASLMPSNEPTVTVTRARQARIAGIQVVRSRRPFRPVVRHRLPCTSAVRTIVDCAGIMSGGDLDALVDVALARRVVRVETLSRAIDDRDLRYYPGRARLAARLAARGVVGSPHPSVLESRMARLFSRHRLPRPKAEVAWGPNRRYRLDFAFPELRLAIEVDGWSSHFAPEQRRQDNRRANALARAGWTVLHYDWWEVTYDPDRVAAEISDAYRKLAAGRGSLNPGASRPATPTDGE